MDIAKAFRHLGPTQRFEPTDRTVALMMWVVGVGQGFAQSHASATLPYTRAGLGISAGEMSALLSIARLASFGALFFSLWADRRGRRRPFLLAYAAICITAGLSGLAGNAAGFTAAQGGVRIATSALSALAVVLLAENLQPAVRAYGISIYAAAGSFGAALALITLPLAAVNYRVPYLLSLLGLLLFPALYRRVGESRLHRPTSAPQSRLRALLVGEQRRWFWISGTAGFLTSAYFAVGLAFTTERLVGELGLSSGAALGISLGGGTLGGVGFFLGGRLADRWGRRPTTVLAVAAALVGGLGLFWLRSPLLLLVAVVISAFGSFAYVPAAGSHRAELFPTSMRATAAAASTAVGTLGSASGLALGRITIDQIGLTGTISLLGVGMGLAAGLTLLLPETRGRELGHASDWYPAEI
jgi:MFS family permease